MIKKMTNPDNCCKKIATHKWLLNKHLQRGLSACFELIFFLFRGIQSPREVEVVFLGNVILLEADKNSLRAQRRLVPLNKLQLPNRA